ncbi:signal peptidase I [Hespellia stercorisuis]|uniref:Signal peptidase I n=1 Tax=Hespellia stercorisuis DSM 15480 TaxID=1121950 RepID=A0A1M6NNX8_9FIRM|nr:signal peptidase I [Hespellia stercorisuis]SHJ97390.1 signal peptidase I [Hespellia stercorisuis DSM 15480]
MGRKDIGFSKSRGKSKITSMPKPKGELRFSKEKTKIQIENGQNIFNWVVQILIVIIIAFVAVWYMGQRINIVDDSMKPVLTNGDVVLANRIIYNASKPKRNDIIVFKPNGNSNANYSVKRIIGLPGEEIEIRDGVVYVNGKKLKESIKTTEITDAGVAGETVKLDGDEYFVLGDNRSGSEDSRMADVGNVKRKDIYGKAWFIVSGADFGFVKH